jgi:pimeloyl-ACP methyl ester carboxylesterase
MSSASRRALALLAFAGALAACGSDERREPSIALIDCRLPRLATAARCGIVNVPEDRSAAGGRRIDLFVAVLPANTLSPKPDPLVILAGGPGQSATSLAPFASRLIEVRRTRDVVLVDQRGTGRSAPLKCAAFAPDEDAVDALDTDPLPRAKACAAELAASGVDVAQYTTEAFVADLEAVREALGYPRWNLWGGSYGTRVALEYLRRHAARVRTLVLDGVAPPSIKIPLSVWTTREHALETLFSACEATASCRKAHPDLRATLDRVREELGSDGREVRIVDPRTGEPHSLRLTFEAVLAGLHPLTYLPELAVTLPEVLERGANGDWAPLAAIAQMVTSDLAEQTSIALHYAVTCAEDVPRVADEDRARIVGLRARMLAERALEVCEVWPKGRQPADATLPVKSDVPALLISGALDPVTPPAYAEEAAKTLPNSRHIVAGGYGHIVSPHACAPRLIAAFVDSAGFADLPTSCIDYLTASTRPPLWPNHLAPAR